MTSYLPRLGGIFKFDYQKRLLLYVLSRLEIFETDNLDLENLNLVFGQKNVFEFRDVGLRLKKLESLLQLPPSFEVNKARVLLLRLTIPLNIYASPILVEVDGVECQLRVRPISEKGTSYTNRDRRKTKPHHQSFGTEQGAARYDPGGRNSEDADSDDLEPAIPTVADLAQSFLQTEPEKNKAEMEAAILAEAPDFDSMSVSEETETFGTGEPITLPIFIKKFLESIFDRLQVRIHGIILNLELEFPSDTLKASITDARDPVTVQLRIEDIDIEGVAQTAEIDSSMTQNPQHKEGKRLISLSKIQGVLISEANLFYSLAQSSAISSPSAAHSEISEGKTSGPRSPVAHDEIQKSEEGLEIKESVASLQGLSTPSIAEHPSGLRSLSASVHISEGGRFDDASERGSDMSGSIRDSMSEVSQSVLQNSAYYGQLTDSECLGEEESEARRPLLSSRDLQSSQSPSSTPRASMLIQQTDDRESDGLDSPENLMQESTLLPPRPYSRFSEERISQSQSHITENTESESLQSSLAIEDISKASRSSVIDENNDEDEDSSSDGEDLTQSKMFNHEDAESLYLSAISHSSSARIPGGWTESSDGNENGPSISRSKHQSQVQDEGLDNLEHARQHSPMDRSTASIADSVRTAKTSASTRSTAAQMKASIPRLPSVVSDLSSTSSEGFNKITKPILFLDRVNIYVPALNQDIPIDPGLDASALAQSTFEQDLAESSTFDLPGAFSGHLPRRNAPSTLPRTSHPPRETEAKTPSKDIEVAIGNLSTQFDISVGRLIFMITRQLQEALNQTPAPASKLNSESNDAQEKGGSSDFKLSVEKIDVAFVERLEGMLGSRRTSLVPEPVPDTDVLLRSTLKGLNITSRNSSSASNTAVTIQKFVFGYATGNIVAFESNPKIHASVKDLKADEGIDVRVNVYKDADVTRVEVVTLPIHVTIDLQRLDETFSWFGGLSSVLNLGSSMASNSTITATSPSKPKSRGVHFETPQLPDDKSRVAQKKPDIRIGGFILELVGAECSIGVETSAVKIVNRDEKIGVSVQAIRLFGPLLKNVQRSPAILAEITSTRIDFLTTPDERDLNRLLSLITPSKSPYDSGDDIMLDNLLRQRRQGSVLKLKMDNFQVKVDNLDDLSYLPDLGEEVSRLATVAKYLPDDDRPGLLSLVSFREFGADVKVNETLGSIKLTSTDIEVAHITLPSLVALSIGTISAHRNSSEELVGEAVSAELRDPRARNPAIMARMIGNEMEPVVKFQFWNLKFEYRVPTLMTILGLVEGATAQDMSASMAASVATLTEFTRSRSPQATRKPSRSDSPTSKPLLINVAMRDCILGLNPWGLPSKLLVCLTDARLTASVPKDKKTSASMNVDKASLLVIDNVANIISDDLTNQPRRPSFNASSSQVTDLCAMGFVSVSYISSAKAIITVSTDTDDEQCVEVELRDDLFVLESCADSTQTLVGILGALAPPSIPSTEKKYRTKVVPVKDLLASLTADAFGTAEGNYDFDEDFDLETFDLDSEFSLEDQDDDIMAGMGIADSSTKLSSRDTHEGVIVNTTFQEAQESEPDGELNFVDNHFATGSVLEGTAHRWDSSKNNYARSSDTQKRKSPLKVLVRDVHVIWNLFDGYDWQETRDTISKAVRDIESKANEKRARLHAQSTFDQDVDEEDDVISDFLFNSIYIGVPTKRDSNDLSAAINQGLNDNATETESVATTTVSSATSRQGGSRKPKQKSLRLSRSKHHKIAFELSGINIDIVAYPPGSGETQSSIDVRILDLEVFDNIHTSTWRKFATGMQKPHERQTGSSMIHLEILNVKPVPELAASEIVLKATILPLRLHVDQDALDFITRFFEFKDETAPSRAPSSPGDAPFIQRAEVNSVVVKLDFKPKRVDYAGLRSGRTTEFMNFVILEEADMTLRRTIIYGVTGFEKLGKCLNDIWMPDIKKNQLPGILAGIAPIRSLVNVGGGVRQLVEVPVREYKKDGRIVRSVSKGAAVFAKTTGTELVRLGAKAMIGFQTVLQEAEGFLGPTKEIRPAEDEESEEQHNEISRYANQPIGVLQGIRGGYAGLQQDLFLATDAFIAIPGEIMESGNAAGVFKAVRNHAPTAILRPPIAVANALGQALLGATNSLDPGNRQRADDKYKKHR
ncbi:hypothetical protein HYFRA_00004886 [Hymenoscyphus fraxineus]|uniref:Autophagy-related protein 2 n=1 Tax=Hymenoscyphus fraxineus TaxID=746836 RepID=A0A9N9KLP5_9HELO|nr:hypothetical protein HYFRA_00004886 [Hymenoscyphus fraxineus]